MQISHALTIPLSVNRRPFQRVAWIWGDEFEEGDLVFRGSILRKKAQQHLWFHRQLNWRNGATYKAIPM
jgi:hypothetical protein